MHIFKVGDKVNVMSNPENVFTIDKAYNEYFYSLEEREVAHLYLLEPNYENIYLGRDLKPVSI